MFAATNENDPRETQLAVPSRYLKVFKEAQRLKRSLDLVWPAALLLFHCGFPTLLKPHSRGNNVTVGRDLHAENRHTLQAEKVC